jgi:hypothetical protein
VLNDKDDHATGRVVARAHRARVERHVARVQNLLPPGQEAVAVHRLVRLDPAEEVGAVRGALDCTTSERG